MRWASALVLIALAVRAAARAIRQYGTTRTTAPALPAGGGALLGRALTGSRGRLVTAVASSTVVCALALHLLITAP
ncbi:hypothetical protein GCM10022419_117080 [Nonomuraea rosea]|uniref:Uncharacterized protein n=1 Tax=Nonomuraea rosea TaxID=638574 RepID=A0ABP6ZMK8_9ACTN